MQAQIKNGQKLVYTFTTVGRIAKVIIIFLPNFIINSSLIYRKKPIYQDNLNKKNCDRSPIYNCSNN